MAGARQHQDHELIGSYQYRDETKSSSSLSAAYYLISSSCKNTCMAPDPRLGLSSTTLSQSGVMLSKNEVKKNYQAIQVELLNITDYLT